jgi:hypothetical protein
MNATTTDIPAPSPSGTAGACKELLDHVYWVLFVLCMIWSVGWAGTSAVARQMRHRQKKDWEERFNACFYAFLGGAGATLVTTLAVRIVTGT